MNFIKITSEDFSIITNSVNKSIEIIQHKESKIEHPYYELL